VCRFAQLQPLSVWSKMSPKPVVLDSFSWPSQSAAEAAFRTILRDSGYKLREPIDNPTHDLMLRELLDVHKDAIEKIGAGVDYFYVGLTSDGDKVNVKAEAIGIWIKRVDGSTEDFSFLTAIRKNSQRSDAKQGLREAVEEQRRPYRAGRFRPGAPVLSDLSGDPIASEEEAHVIYLDPTWGQLTTAFANLEGGWDRLAVHSGRGNVKIGSELLEPGVKAKWVAFHDEHARFGLATASENAQRPRGDDNGWTP
jgi:hypothetical protein